MRSAILPIFCLLSPVAAHAQNVVNVDQVQTRSTMLMSKGKYNSCGLRFVGMAIPPGGPAFPSLGFDMNVTLMRGDGMQLYAVHKAEVFQADRPAKKSDDLKLLKLDQTWLQVEGAPAAQPRKSAITGDNGYASMSIYDADEFLKPMARLASKEEQPVFLLGVEIRGEKATRIYRFAPGVTDADGQAFLACSNALFDQMLKDEPKK